MASVPERLRWTVDILAVRPADRVLEIGCGRGAAAEQRNREHIAAGRAAFRTVSLEDLPGAPATFDKIFAVNVNLFWLRPIPDQLDLVKRLLAPAGALYLSYAPPSPRAPEITGKLVAGLLPYGFSTTTLTSTTGTGAELLCVVARPA